MEHAKLTMAANNHKFTTALDFDVSNKKDVPIIMVTWQHNKGAINDYYICTILH